MEWYRFVIFGKVQGVFYRKSVSQALMKKQFKGYIQNLSDAVGEPFPPIPREQIRAIPINTARGCPYKCSFCYHAFRGVKYRWRSAESIVQEMLSAVPSGPVLDPFVGSGSMLVAARAIDRSAIGVDNSEANCEIAAQRLSQGVLDLGQ